MESAFLFDLGAGRWELADMKYKECRCFGGMDPEKGESLAVGSMDSCYAAARLLGRHVDIIKVGILELSTKVVSP